MQLIVALYPLNSGYEALKLIRATEILNFIVTVH